MTHQTCLIGYPPADDNVRNFLTTNETSRKEAESLVRRFLVALFKKTTKFLKEEASQPGLTKLDRIQTFRDFMTKDQLFERAGAKRVEFYNSVIARAREVRRKYFIPFHPL